MQCASSLLPRLESCLGRTKRTIVRARMSHNPSLQEMRRTAALQRQRERERNDDGRPRPSPAASVVASEELDALSSYSCASQISAPVSQSSVRSLKTVRSTRSLESRATRSYASASEHDLDEYERVDGKLSRKSSISDAQAVYFFLLF